MLHHCTALATRRELSPALANRFTTVWVPALEDEGELAAILAARLASEWGYGCDQHAEKMLGRAWVACLASESGESQWGQHMSAQISTCGHMGATKV